jgi:HK97 family phage major capsid protein
MLTYLSNLRNERDTLSATSTGILEKAAAEDRDVTETERQSIETMAERCAVIDGDLARFSEQYESQRAYAKLRAALDDADAEPEPRKILPAQTRSAELAHVEPWGKLFVESAEFRSYNGAGTSQRVTVPGLFERNPIDLATGWGLPPVPYTATIPQPAITTPLLDAVAHVTTNSNLVQWLVESGTYPAAPVVPEGGLKPEANFQVTVENGTLETYAHYKGITRQALANIPMIQSIVETQLRGGIFASLEAAILAVLAAAADPVIPDIDASGTGGMLAGIRTAIGTVQSAGFPNANSVLLNPADWASLDVSVMDATQNGPSRQTGFWGLRPIASAAVPSGTAYVGDIRSAVTLFDQGTASVYMSDSHADYFIRNILVVLAEIMALAMVTQGKALARVNTQVVTP